MSVAERKDLYAYWKGKVTEGLLEDIGRRAKKGSNSTGSAGDFLLVNVASQEVGGSKDCLNMIISDICVFCRFRHRWWCKSFSPGPIQTYLPSFYRHTHFKTLAYLWNVGMKLADIIPT